jgi:hypothetical protein
MMKSKKILKTSIELAAEQERGKKRYLARKIQEQEAEQEIKEYEDRSDEGGTDRLHGERFIGRERRSGKLS